MRDDRSVSGLPVAAGAGEVLDAIGRLVVCAAFVLAGTLKLDDLPGLRGTLYLSRVTRPWVGPLTVLLPAVELGGGLALLGGDSGWLAAVLLLALLLAFIAFLATDRAAGEGCACFGRRRSSSQVEISCTAS